ncbi:MAG: uncharacterized protein QG656_2154 [Candidatus Hydrogenedentes bacterium]|nr:uncharacterized protein [Candidatus Hydrogenedentota bacterium]
MNIDSYDFVHLTIHAMGGAIHGKTKLQKTVYFLGTITGCLDELGYRPHFYGPYSDEVAGVVDRLRSLGFLDATATALGTDARGFEMARTDYVLSVDGKAVAELKVKQHPEAWKELVEAVKKLRAAGDLDYMKLSVAAKTYFVLGKKGGQASQEELVKLAKKFGWSVSDDQVTEASHFLQSLNLVQLRSA